MARTILALALGILIPTLVTALATLVQITYDFPFTFLYMPALLFVAYLGGLLAGLTGAAVSTLLVDYFFVGPPGLTLQEAQADAIPTAFFLISGIIIAAAGDQYRRYQARLSRDLIATQRTARAEALIVAVSDLLASGQEWSWVSQVICQRIEEFLGDPCALVMKESDGEVVQLIRSGATGSGAPTLEAGLADTLLRHDDSLIQHILGAARPVVVTHRNPAMRPMLADSRVAREWFEDHGLAGVLAAPLRFGAESLGYLGIFTTRQRGWENEDIRTIESVADRVAAAIHRDRLDAQRRRRARSARLVDSLMVEFAREGDLLPILEQIAKRATETLGDWGSITLLEADSPSLTLAAVHHRDAEKARRFRAAFEMRPVPKDNPLVSRILSASGPVAVYADDPVVQQLLPQVPLFQEVFTHLKVHGELNVPIKVGGETLGFFAVGIDAPRTWDQEDLRLASLIADRTGVAIKNARLRDAEHAARLSAEREARRVQAINRIVAIASSAVDLGSVFDEFAEALQLLLPYTWVTISLRGPTPDVLVTPYIKGPTAP
ncbi:MAG: GAF domain-containing protein, partial [bacterium]